MSISDNLFLDTQLSQREVANEMARVMGGSVKSDPGGIHPEVIFHQLESVAGWVAVGVDLNGPPEPDSGEIVTHHAIHCRIWCYTKDEETQMRAARIVMRRFVAEGVHWPAILVHDFGWVTAAFDPQHGYRECSPGPVSFLDLPDKLWGDLP